MHLGTLRLFCALAETRSFTRTADLNYLSHPAGKTTIKLAVPHQERDWWRRLWEKILSPFPNCNAVENHPVFTSQSL
jgi:hypothetical protein